MLHALEIQGIRVLEQISGHLSHERPGLSSTGKRAGRPLTASVSSSKGTIYVKDQITNKSFLVNSGADECVFPASLADQALPRTTDLVAANGSSVRTFGRPRITLRFSGEDFTHTFWVATVSRPILGADFFAEHDLLIDLHHCRLLSQRGNI